MIKKIVYCLCIGSFVFLSACNTMSGVGEDIQRGGEAIENSADKHKN